MPDHDQNEIGNRQEVFTKHVHAGRRTYYMDVKATKSGKDFYLTISEKVKKGENEFEKHRIFLYKEDFEKFVDALDEAIDFAKAEIAKVE